MSPVLYLVKAELYSTVAIREQAYNWTKARASSSGFTAQTGPKASSV